VLGIVTDPTTSEISRRLDAMERQIIHREAYNERQRALDKELADHDLWHQKHDDSHTWLWRLVAATALTVLVSLLIQLLSAGGAIPGAT